MGNLASPTKTVKRLEFDGVTLGGSLGRATPPKGNRVER